MESDSASGPATKRLPPWMLAPGAPTHPNFAAYGSKLSKLAEEKKKLFDELNLLRGSLKGDENRSQVDEERASLRLRMSEIDAQRKKEKDLRVGKNDEISRVRKQRRETSDRLRSLLSDLGGFTDLKEIDAAIQYVMNKMETGSGGLSAEKRTLKRLHQLEEAKTLLLQLQPLEEAIQEAGEREVMLQQEYREIHERIGILNKEYEDEFQSKQNIDKEARKGGTERVEIAAKCSALYARITKLNEEISSLRAQRTKESADWDTWCTEARAKYDQKMEAEREARHQKFLEKKKASKLQRARQRQNPYEIEIISCDTVIQYLLQKKQMIRKDEEEKTKRLAAANFDARAAAPPGFVVLNEGKWQDSKSKPQKSSKPNTKTSSAQKKRDEPTKVLQHPEDKLKLFRMIDVEPPLSLEFINEKVNEIKTKQEEFRSFIVDGEPEMSSDEEEEEEEGEGINVPVDGEPKENSS